MTLGSRRAVVLGSALVTAALLLIPVGRWQAQRGRAADQHRIEAIATLAGPLGGRRLTAYRLATFNCLLYRVQKNPFALELCFDPHGRLVEAIDRRHYGYDPVIGSVRYDPGAAPITVPPARLLKLLHKSGGLRGVELQHGLLPGPFIDAAPILTLAAHKQASKPTTTK